MTGFFDSLCQREALTEGLSFPGGAEPRPYTRLPIAFASYVRGDVGIAPYENAKCLCVIRAGGAEPSAPTSVYRASALFFLCHSEGAKRPWESASPRPQARNPPLPL